MRALALLIPLTGCQLVFALDEAPVPACAHEDLLLCLSFERDSATTARDRSPNGFDAAMTATRFVSRETPTGQTEGALEVDDDSSVIVTENDPFDLEEPFSIDLWFNVENPLESDERMLVDNHTQYTVHFPPGGGAVHCSFLPGGALAFGAATLLEGGWHHIACVWDGTAAFAYLDGTVSPTSTSGSGTIRSEPKPLSIGKAGDVVDARPFTGEIDNVRVWLKPLGPTQIDLFARGLETEE